MSGTVILLVVIVVTYYLGKYAIEQGQRVEQHKKFMINLRDHDKKHKSK